jgi:hypothetical protein
LEAVPAKLVVGCNVAVWAAASYCALVARNADLVAVPKPKFPRRVTGFDRVVGGGRNDRGALPLINPLGLIDISLRLSAVGRAVKHKPAFIYCIDSVL